MSKRRYSADDTIENPRDQRAKRTYAVSGGKEMVFLLDNLECVFNIGDPIPLFINMDESSYALQARTY